MMRCARLRPDVVSFQCGSDDGPDRRTGHEEPTNYRECTLLYFLSVSKFTYGTPTRQPDRGRTTPRSGAARHGRHMSLVQVSSNFELDSESNQQYSYGYDL